MLRRVVKKQSEGFITNHAVHGFTLIEIMVASTIFVGVVAIGVATFAASSGYRAKTKITQEVNQVARYAMEMITRDIKAADGEGPMKIVAGVSRPVFPDCAGKNIQGFAFLNNIGDIAWDGDCNPLNLNMNGIVDINDNAVKIVVLQKGTNCKGVFNKKIKINYSQTDEPLDGGGTYKALNRTVSYLHLPNECFDPDECTAQADCIGSDRTLFNQPGIELTQFEIAGDYPHETSNKQPYVKIKLGFRTYGYDTAKPEERAKIYLETTVTSRLVDFK